jgi:hypothetical protein
MTNVQRIELGELMPEEGRNSINPIDDPDEVFDLLSIPAYDKGFPEAYPFRGGARKPAAAAPLTEARSELRSQVETACDDEPSRWYSPR